MKSRITLYTLFFVLVNGMILHAQNSKKDVKYIFFLHNRFVQLYDLGVQHPQYGKAEYLEILDKFRKQGFLVMSEKRPVNTQMQAYAHKIVSQVDSLMKRGIKPENITIIGTSMGGYIAQYVSTYLKNPGLNFVLIGCYMDNDLQSMPDIQLCGNILSIYEATDTLGVSMKQRIARSTHKIPHFREIELHTNLKHGFLYHPTDEWMIPAMLWANGDYAFKTRSK